MPPRAGFSDPPVYPTELALTAALFGQGLACFAFARSRKAWRRGNNPADIAMSIAAGVWLLHLLALTVLASVHAEPTLLVAAVCVGVQALTISTSVLLAITANVATARIYLVLLIQLVAGAATLYWFLEPAPHWPPTPRPGPYQAWVFVNLVGSAVLTLAVAASLLRRRRNANWLALVGSTLSLALWVDGLFPREGVVLPTSFTEIFYALFLLTAWHLGKQRDYEPHFGAPASGFAPSTGFEMLSGFGTVAADSAASAVAIERRRIAQDLHDNVGSQIDHILSSLGRRHSRAQETVGVALEQCLLDLKMTVDAIDSISDSVPEALGRLRQRVQRPLDMLGIRLLWRVRLDDELEAARGWISLQVLRIAQECLTNVMRHSSATVVDVDCHFSRGTAEVVLEIRDNGCGIKRGRSEERAGKGLDGMRRRAASAGGLLVVSSKVGGGTRVRLTLPLTPP
ncbi:MAG: periplasmic sensor signal transduction histidine kinase [Ramlibacter sp.]|nr:periplasmic sensor signal transduction histidine kinase [Ramlibacter sp.]